MDRGLELGRLHMHSARTLTHMRDRTSCTLASLDAPSEGQTRGKAIVGLAAGALRFTHVVRHCMRAGQERATAGQDQRRARKT